MSGTISCGLSITLYFCYAFCFIDEILMNYFRQPASLFATLKCIDFFFKRNWHPTLRSVIHGNTESPEILSLTLYYGDLGGVKVRWLPWMSARVCVAPERASDQPLIQDAGMYSLDNSVHRGQIPTQVSLWKAQVKERLLLTLASNRVKRGNFKWGCSSVPPVLPLTNETKTWF